MLDLPSWLLIIPILAGLIFVHELGHFVTAKFFGIRVLEFGFGFPPRIFGISFRGTLYSLNLIPLGGFVRMLGEEDPSDPNSFSKQSVPKRLLVLSAGSLMNLLVPVIIFTVLLILPHDELIGGSVLISAVAPYSPAAQAGIRPGDIVTSVDGNPTISTQHLIDSIDSKRGAEIVLGIRRSSQASGLAISPEFVSTETVRLIPRNNPPSLEVVEHVADTTKEVSIIDARKYNPDLEIGDTLTQGAIGVMVGLINPKFDRASMSVSDAIPSAISMIWTILDLTWNGIRAGISNGSNPGLAGPVGIAHATGEIVDTLGLSMIFQLSAILSISLAVVNMLPFPALDGGRFMFVLVEWIRRGKRVSAHKESLVHLIGFALLICLILVVTYFDVVNILSGHTIFD